MRFVVERVHLDFDLILPLHVTRTAYVEVFVQKSFTPITVHVNIRHCNGSNECKFLYIMLVKEKQRESFLLTFLRTEFAKEIAGAVRVEGKDSWILPCIWLGIDGYFPRI